MIRFDNYTEHEIMAWSLTRHFAKLERAVPMNVEAERAYYLKPLVWAEAQRRVAFEPRMGHEHNPDHADHVEGEPPCDYRGMEVWNCGHIDQMAGCGCACCSGSCDGI